MLLYTLCVKESIRILSSFIHMFLAEHIWNISLITFELKSCFEENHRTNRVIESNYILRELTNEKYKLLNYKAPEVK